MDIIEALSEVPELGVSELARHVGIAKSTAHRTCAVLAARGLLDRTDDGGYRLGLRLVERRSAAPLLRLGILRSGPLVRANVGAMLFVGNSDTATLHHPK